MSDFRCPYYFWNGDFCCAAVEGARPTSLEFEIYCTSPSGCYNCPRFKK